MQYPFVCPNCGHEEKIDMPMRDYVATGICAKNVILKWLEKLNHLFVVVVWTKLETSTEL